MPIRFRCPQCRALMQVADDAAGAKTQCPKCTEIVEVPRASASPSPNPDAASSAGSSTPTQERGNSTSSEYKQVRCPHCRQVMRASAGAKVQCPHCGKPVQAPGGTTAPGGFSGSDTSKQPAGFGPDPAADLGSNDFPQPYQPPPNKPAPVYSPPNYGSAPQVTYPYVYQPPGQRASRDWQYIVLGIVFLIAAVFLLLALISALASAVRVMISDRTTPEMFTFAFTRAGLGLIITLPLAIVYFQGGIALVRRCGLQGARIAAIVACIPILNLCFLQPFGIWAVILLFSPHAKRDFDED